MQLSFDNLHYTPGFIQDFDIYSLQAPGPFQDLLICTMQPPGLIHDLFICTIQASGLIHYFVYRSGIVCQSSCSKIITYFNYLIIFVPSVMVCLFENLTQSIYRMQKQRGAPHKTEEGFMVR